MIYAFLGLILMGLIGTGGGYWHGMDVGEKRYAAKLEVAQQKVQEQADKLKDEAVQKQADIVAAFDKGRADVQEKIKVVYVKGAQVVAADRGITNPVCVMAADSLGLLNAARAGAEVGAGYELKPAPATPPAQPVAPSVVAPRPAPIAVPPPVSSHPKPRPVSDLRYLLGLAG